MNNLQNNPFRILFPLAFLVGSIGVVLFIPNLFGIESYPINFHKKVMIDVFMNLIVTGFLFTAVPQFTGTDSITKSELLISTTLLIGALFGSSITLLFHGLMLSFYVYLLIILASRLLTAKQAIPYSFYFLPLAVFYGVCAQLVWLLPIEGLEIYAQKFLYFGYFLGVVMGVGLRLIPGLLGHVDIVKKQRKNYESGRPLTGDFKLLLVLFNVQVIFDVINMPVTMMLSRFLFILIPSIMMFKIFRTPKSKTWHAWGIWLSIWSLIVGVLLIFADPANSSHWLHLIFINGFVLLAFMVITRVTRAHNNLDIKKEDSKILLFIIGFTIFTGLTRVSAFLIPNSYANHLAYAAAMLIALFIGLFIYLNRFKLKK
jgi:uncharacterized protein involved in response to NO